MVQPPNADLFPHNNGKGGLLGYTKKKICSFHKRAEFAASIRPLIISCLILAFMMAASPRYRPISAQDSATPIAYIKTFDLPTTQATSGAYAGIDPTGAKVAFWHVYTKAREDAMTSAADLFNKSNPWKITIQPIYKGQYTDLYQAMLAAFEAKSPPQLALAYQDEAARYQMVNALVDLNDFVDDPVYGLGQSATDDFFPGVLASDVNPELNDQRLGMAAYRSMEVLYYNADALKALGYDSPPQNWDQFGKMVCKFAQNNPGKIGYEIRTDASAIAAAAFAQGGDIYDASADKFTFDSPEVQVMPQAMQSLLGKHCVSLPADETSAQNDFVAGKTLFYEDSTNNIPLIQDAMKTANQTFSVDVAPIPYKDHPVQDVYGPSLSIPRSTKAQELAAWLFIRWLTESDQQAAWAMATYYLPVRPSTAVNLSDFFKANPIYQHAFKLLGLAKAESPIVAYGAVRFLAVKAFNNVLAGRPVADEFGSLNNAANQVVMLNMSATMQPTSSR